MEIKLHEILIRDLIDGYIDNAENGVVAYHGRLNVRPPFQREFIYKDTQRNEVIRTVRKNFPLNVMYWSISGKNERGENTYELLDGQQRTLSICQFCDSKKGFTMEMDGYTRGFWVGFTDDERNQILDYKLNIYICDGNEREKLDWFKIINIAGEELTPQELRNAIYTGPWLTDAKRKFSKMGCVAYKKGEGYVTGVLNRQDYLETALKWIVDKENMVLDKNITIEDYMASHQNDPSANDLWRYFSGVVDWVKTIFPEHRKIMKKVGWGMLFNRYEHNLDGKDTSDLEEEISKLIKDDDVCNKTGIYAYLLSGEEKNLEIRAFSQAMKEAAYEEQKGICKICRKHFEIEDMEADHIIPWSKGGKTSTDNCQMLCRKCNREKSDK